MLYEIKKFLEPSQRTNKIFKYLPPPKKNQVIKKMPVYICTLKELGIPDNFYAKENTTFGRCFLEGFSFTEEKKDDSALLTHFQKRIDFNASITYSSNGTSKTNKSKKINPLVNPFLFGHLEADLIQKLKKQYQQVQKAEEKLLYLFKKGNFSDLVFITFLDSPFPDKRSLEVGRFYIIRLKKTDSLTGCFQSNVAFEYTTCIMTVCKKIVRLPVQSKFPYNPSLDGF